MLSILLAERGQELRGEAEMLSKYLSVWSSISRDIHDIFSKLHPSLIPVEKLRQFSSFAEVKGYILSV